jgi:hypothetical protein
MILVASLGHIFLHYVVKSILSVLCAFITSVGFAMEILTCFLSPTTTKHKLCFVCFHISVGCNGDCDLFFPNNNNRALQNF